MKKKIKEKHIWITEEQMEELLLYLGHDICDREDIIDSSIVCDLASDYGFFNLGDCGYGFLFIADKRDLCNKILKPLKS